MLRLRQSKLFIAFLVALMLVFTINQSKPKAFAPIPFMMAIGVGMAAEALVTTGVKAVNKAVLKKQAANYSDDIARSGKFDWAGLNPYRNKDGSITLSPSANDRAKMAGLIAGTLAGSLYHDEDGDGVPELACPQESGRHSVKVYPGSGLEELLPYVNAFYYETETTRSYRVESAHTREILLSYDTSNFETDIMFASSGMNPNYILPAFKFEQNGLIETATNASILKTDPRLGNAQQQVDFAIENGVQIDYCNGLFIPSTIHNVYNAPMNMDTTFNLPNSGDLTNQSFTINNIFPPSEDEGEVTWEEIENYFAGDFERFNQIMDSNIDNYVENGVITENVYTIGEVNNVYTDVNYSEKKEDVNPPLMEVEPVPDEGGELVPVDPIDRGMLQVISESYSYLADSVDTSLEAMRGVVNGAKGIVDFLDTSFRWLPAEWRAMFGAAFILGVFAHFFRR